MELIDQLRGAICILLHTGKLKYFYHMEENDTNIDENIDEDEDIDEDIGSILSIIIEHYGKDRLKDFMGKSIIEFDLLDWEENILILIFCVNLWLNPKDFKDVLKALLCTRVDPTYLPKVHPYEVERLKLTFTETPLKFNIMKNYLIKKINEIEASQLEELIKKQQESHYDYLAEYSAEYLEY